MRPGDLTPGDLYPTAPDDPRLEPGFTGADALELDDETGSGLGVLRPEQWQIGLGREVVLSAFGRGVAADRWFDGDFGPEAPMARNAPGTATSDFFICASAQPRLDAHPGAPGDNQGFAVFGEQREVCGAARDVFDEREAAHQGRVGGRCFRRGGGQLRHQIGGASPRVQQQALREGPLLTQHLQQQPRRPHRLHRPSRRRRRRNYHCLQHRFLH